MFPPTSRVSGRRLDVRAIRWSSLGLGLGVPWPGSPSSARSKRSGGGTRGRASRAHDLPPGLAGLCRRGVNGAQLRGRGGLEAQEAPPLEHELHFLQRLRHDAGLVEGFVDLLGLDRALGPGLLRERQLRCQVLHLLRQLTRGGPVKDRAGAQVEGGGPPETLPQLGRLDAEGHGPHDLDRSDGQLCRTKAVAELGRDQTTGIYCSAYIGLRHCRIAGRKLHAGAGVAAPRAWAVQRRGARDERGVRLRRAPGSNSSWRNAAGGSGTV